MCCSVSLQTETITSQPRPSGQGTGENQRSLLNRTDQKEVASTHQHRKAPGPSAPGLGLERVLVPAPLPGQTVSE